MKNKKEKKPNKRLIEFIRILLEWIIPVILFLIAFLLSIFVPIPFYFEGGKFNFVKASIIIPLLIIFILLAIKLIKNWWKWLKNNNIIK